MRLTIRLYKRHDLDLLSLYMADNYDFRKEFKKTLKAYIHGKMIRNKLPQTKCESVYSLPPKVSFHIKLEEEKDEDIKNFINSITIGRRNNILKNIFRNSFPPVVVPYLRESETNKFYISQGEKKNELQQDRRI